MVNLHPRSTAFLIKRLEASLENNDWIIPKQIFFFWDRLPMPAFVQHCFELWQRNHPGYEIYLIDEAKIHFLLQGDFPRNMNQLSVAQRSDWYRLSLLEKYGGIYIDATTVCLSPVDAWVDHSLSALQGFNVPSDNPNFQIMENWAIACPRGNSFITKWREEFRYAISIGIDNYKHVCEAQKIPLMEYLLPDHLPYLSCHAAWINAREKEPDTHFILKSSIATDGPFGWLEEADWDMEEAINKLLLQPINHYVSPFLKIRCCDRLRINRHLLQRQYSDDSIFCQALLLPSNY